MKKYKTSIKFLLTAAIMLSFVTSCKKDFLDINQNPNSPPDAGVAELLPSAEAAIAHVVGNNFQIFGGIWGQYWTQSNSSSQYKRLEQYNPAADDFDRPWKALYADALEDLKTIITKAGTANQNYTAISKILQGYTFQLLTDNFGEIPFTDALKPDAGILSPRYDNQETVYNGIIALVSEGVSLIDENAVIGPGDDDILLHGDMALWKEFGNTLLLRVYMRLSERDPVKAQAGIAALETAGAAFLAAGEEVRIDYTPANPNPLYSSLIDLSFVQNLVGSATAIDYLNGNNDPRVDAFYSPASNGTQVEFAQGNYNAPPGTPVSWPSPVTGGNIDDEVASASAPVKLMTGYESLFLQAEAVARGWMTGDAQALYEEGITESFVSYGLQDTDATNYFTQTAIAFPSAGTTADKIEAIITQKWIAMDGNQCDEGWTEWRRTGFPDFFTESVNSIIGAGRFPARFFYPSTESTRNGNFPGQPLIYTKVWWDVN